MKACVKILPKTVWKINTKKISHRRDAQQYTRVLSVAWSPSCLTSAQHLLVQRREAGQFEHSRRDVRPQSHGAEL